MRGPGLDHNYGSVRISGFAKRMHDGPDLGDPQSPVAEGVTTSAAGRAAFVRPPHNKVYNQYIEYMNRGL